MTASEPALVHRALERMWQRLADSIEGALFERRSGLVQSLAPTFPLPQCSGPWVVEDSAAAVAGLPEAIAEAEAAGMWPWVQTRSGHERTRRAAFELGLTHAERTPAMALRPGELVGPAAKIEITDSGEGDAGRANEILAACFGAPKDLFERFAAILQGIDEASWYVGRVDGVVVSTAVGVTLDGVTGVFNVATPLEHRGRGYGGALTAHAARAGFEAGSQLAFLQSSDLGHGVYRRLGFRDVEEYVLLTRPIPG